jgi:PhzF family phenazine biosynthesis protein
MNYNYFHVDAFIGAGLSGNPAGVCLLKKPLLTAQMQGIAAEINLPETSFVWDEGDKSAIRWFTPEREVDLCGHGTLAAAHVMFSVVNPGLHDICFRSASGDLHVKRDADNFGRLSLDFPSLPPEQIAIAAELHALIGADIQQVWQAKSLLVVLENEQQVRLLQPDIAALIAYTGRGVMVTAPGDQVDFVSRYFTLGSNEDPVTGSAHCTLMPYWAARLGRPSLHARQISARGGELFCTLSGDRTLIAGEARIFMKGEISLFT